MAGFMLENDKGQFESINLEEWELQGNHYQEAVMLHEPCGSAFFPENMKEAIVEIQEHLESGCPSAT